MNEDVSEALRRNASHLQAILNRIKKPLGAIAETTPPGRVRLLDIYMLEEYFVGRHDPAAVILWQKNHDKNLRTTDILSPDLSE